MDEQVDLAGPCDRTQYRIEARHVSRIHHRSGMAESKDITHKPIRGAVPLCKALFDFCYQFLAALYLIYIGIALV
jgi:hypothetical protein